MIEIYLRRLYPKIHFRSLFKCHQMHFFFEPVQIVVPPSTTAKNAVTSPNFLVWIFCGKAQFLHSFGRFAQNYAEAVPFHKVSAPGN